MKKMILGILILGSFSTYAQDGYEKAKENMKVIKNSIGGPPSYRGGDNGNFCEKVGFVRGVIAVGQNEDLNKEFSYELKQLDWKINVKCDRPY